MNDALGSGKVSGVLDSFINPDDLKQIEAAFTLHFQLVRSASPLNQSSPIPDSYVFHG
ncbi:uncharacterized protein PGTG_11948 [Puccinia graminis f. sp. tritici CRL 75-36-700-3]|uniref:Uncharacterized protein n=1 Tax=Puccinia graminis f. sp. tritici (strain CRL 75-36-700-3 / race SCCL) TaxID=418459 RepID=E3KMR7_PUCGT|nr:uncharacterized protein PGTG_11948 [Puccinia graminis f. sp. tritici CRL 75-36-700-3]EFP85592.1 hypothetical protein PGTG_11948 [Puccinia graminis f. sp. tritici CRL 75-36-700-3]